jgi:putative oxidoreductase
MRQMVARSQSPESERNRLIIPALQSLYVGLEPLGYSTARFFSGAFMAIYGWKKVLGDGMMGQIDVLQRHGLEPAVPLAYFTSWLELIGGIAVAVGLLTRPFAALLAFQLFVIVAVVDIPNQIKPGTIIWLTVYVMICLRGGGPFSIDRLIGKEI